MRKTGLIFIMITAVWTAAWIATRLYGQPNIPPDILLEKDIEDILQNTESETEIEINAEFLETLDYIKENPVNINAASANDLRELFFLSDNQIDAIIRYRNDYGKIIGIHELYHIPFFNEQAATILEPYIYFGSEEEKNWDISTALYKGKHTALFRYGQTLKKSKAYKEKIYAGNPASILARYNFKFSDNMRAGLAFEKDAGEKGVDFFSGYIAFGGNGGGGGSGRGFKEWIIGTYKASFGYGLGIGSGGIFGGISNPALPVRPATGIRPYSSGGETGFFSGSAIILNPAPQTEINLFYSNNLLDASSEQMPDTTEIYDIASSTGYHRTTAEIAKRKTLRRQVFGVAAEHYFTKFRIGAQINFTHFDNDIKQEIKIYNRYNSLASQVLNGSIYYQWLLGNLNLFGEIAATYQFKNAVSTALNAVSAAFLQGINWSFGERLKIIFYYRYYPRNYAACFASPPGKSDNERGYNFQAALAIYKSWKLTFQTDHYLREWFSYPEKPPFNGHDYKVELGSYAKRYTFYTYYRYRLEDDSKTHRLRLHFSFNPSEEWAFATRVELCGLPVVKGILAYQEIKYSFKRTPLKLSARIALFDTKDYDSRIYSYEQDVLYGFSIPALYDRGTRFYFLATYKPLRRLSFWLRYAHTFMDNRFSFGSGNDLIESRYKPEIKLQVRVSF